jgi:hypothetical protein
VVHEQKMLRQNLHELIIDPLLGSAMPSQVQLLPPIAKHCISDPALAHGFTQVHVCPFLGACAEVKGLPTYGGGHANVTIVKTRQVE